MQTLQNVYHPISDNIARPWTLAHLLSFPELRPVLEQADGGKGPDFAEQLTAAVGDANNGVTTRVGMVSAIGRKAL